MKIPRIIFCALFCARVALGQDATSHGSVVPAPCYPCAISNVISQFSVAIRQSRFLAQPTAHENFVAQINHLPPPQPHPVLSLKKLVDISAGIDTSRCPDDFKTAWKNFITAISAESIRLKNGNGIKDLAAFLYSPGAGAVALAGDVEKANAQKQAQRTAVQEAFLQLRLVCSSYGVK